MASIRYSYKVTRDDDRHDRLMSNDVRLMCVHMIEQTAKLGLGCRCRRRWRCVGSRETPVLNYSRTQTTKMHETKVHRLDCRPAATHTRTHVQSTCSFRSRHARATTRTPISQRQLLDRPPRRGARGAPHRPGGTRQTPEQTPRRAHRGPRKRGEPR